MNMGECTKTVFMMTKTVTVKTITVIMFNEANQLELFLPLL